MISCDTTQQEQSFRKYLDFSEKDGGSQNDERKWTESFLYFFRKVCDMYDIVLLCDDVCLVCFVVLVDKYLHVKPSPHVQLINTQHITLFASISRCVCVNRSCNEISFSIISIIVSILEDRCGIASSSGG